MGEEKESDTIQLIRRLGYPTDSEDELIKASITLGMDTVIGHLFYGLLQSRQIRNVIESKVHALEKQCDIYKDMANTSVRVMSDMSHSFSEFNATMRERNDEQS